MLVVASRQAIHDRQLDGDPPVMSRIRLVLCRVAVRKAVPQLRKQESEGRHQGDDEPRKPGGTQELHGH